MNRDLSDRDFCSGVAKSARTVARKVSQLPRSEMQNWDEMSFLHQDFSEPQISEIRGHASGSPWL